MRTFLSIVIGFFSGFLIYFESAMLFIPIKSKPSFLFVFITFFGGWALTSYLISKDAKSILKIIKRGFLIGAAEWLLMLPIGIIFSSKSISNADIQTSAGQVGTAIGGGIVAFLTGGVAVAMTIVCLIGFTITYFLGKEMQPEEAINTKKCPYCSETIKAQAKLCRFCGKELEPT